MPRSSKAWTVAGLLVASFGASAVTSAQGFNSTLGAAGSQYTFSDAKIKGLFGGGAISNFNFGLVPSGRKEGLTWDGSTVQATGNGNRLFVVTTTFGFEKHFLKSGGSWGQSQNYLYLRAGYGLAYYDYGVNFGLGDNREGRVFKGVTVFEAGYFLTQELAVVARIYQMPEIDRMNFSGTQLLFTIGGFRL